MSPAMALNEQKGKDDIPKSQYQKGVKHLCEKGHLNAVPKKYILPVSERPTKSSVEDSNVVKQNLQLPIINFSELLGPNRPRGSNRPQVLRSLANACQHYGFFQGPASVKPKTPVRDFLKLLCHPLPDLLLHWPASPVDIRKVVATNAEETKHLFLVVMEAILESLGIVEANQEEDDNILKEFENESQMMVASFYPPCPQPDLTLGMPPHSDYGFLTLLLQDEVEGLQIQHQDKWVTVQPIPNASVVNVGDHLEIYSNGKYKSVLHTIVVNEIKSRVSVASLHSVSKMVFM
ncbi:Putative 2-oxoglutarate/Fe(II)-dependent dioxygenase [Glycine soja]|uniref:Putative 2-oxoglutarate/Fe(II)-dependent dioxygenase n=1 Tax=Glycine soja TaxID=3848 RepID=A0A0B2PXR0_GLYSO|nr:Putative 2-oxoglutarate/Fe(II)-dependent dioxygenase [Glycine soja]